MQGQESAYERRKYQRQRKKLVKHLRERGITNERVLEAFNNVPRHLFVDAALRGRAYQDEALPIGMKQTISQPFTVAYQTSLLDPSINDRVLEIGTGSGYQAAILCETGARVFSIERHQSLLDRTNKLLEDLGYRVLTTCGDGTYGWTSFAPFDGIIVTAGAKDIPETLLEQLRPGDDEKSGGRLIIPVGDSGGQHMYRITRTGENEFKKEEFHSFRFVPLIGEGGGGME